MNIFSAWTTSTTASGCRVDSLRRTIRSSSVLSVKSGAGLLAMAASDDRAWSFVEDLWNIDPATVPEIPKAWHNFLGSYGPTFIPLVVSVKHGHLYAMTENMFDYRLAPLNQTVFNLPTGMYLGEQLVFHRGADGRVHSAVLGNMTLKRIA